MPTVTESQKENVSIDVARLRRKVAWRTLPLVFLLYIVAYLDRANVGFAKLRMASDLHFSDAVYGLGIGIFFIGYLLLEIPGALLVERWSARKWFARILITWGFISALTAFVTTPMQFNVARFSLARPRPGSFRASSLLHALVHLQDRTRALPAGDGGAIQPGNGRAGVALLLDVNWLGFAGWQWLFILKGFRSDPGIRDATHHDGSPAPGEVAVAS
jgi:ACS family tartrate transporter-like MFS transporter